MEKGGSFGRDTVYMQILNTRVVSTANFRISTSHGVCVRALSRISFSDFSSCDVGGNVDDEKKERKEKRKKERKEKKRSFLFSGRSVNRAWKSHAFLTNDRDQISRVPF